MTKTKNFFMTMLSLVLVLCCAFMLTACGVIADDSEDVGGGGASTTDTLKTEAQIKSALGNKYYVEVSVDSNESDDPTVFTLVTDGVYLYTNLAGGVLLKFAGNDYIIYTKASEESDEYTSMMRITPNAQNTYDIGSLSYMLGYTGTIDYTSKRSIIFLGRPAVEYTISNSISILGYTSYYTETTVIDSATGLCLKHSASGSASAGGEHVSGSYSFECTKFYVGNDSHITGAINAHTSQIAVSEWNEEVFAQAGLEESTSFEGPAYLSLDEIIAYYNVTEAFDDVITPNLKFFTASKYDFEEYGLNATSYSYAYILDTNLDNENEFGYGFIEALVNNFYRAGANHSSEGEGLALADLIEEYDEEDETCITFNFCGYIQGETSNYNNVGVNATWENGAWLIEIEVQIFNTMAPMSVRVRSDTTYLVIANPSTVPANVDELGSSTQETVNIIHTKAMPVRYNEGGTPAEGYTKWETVMGASYENASATNNGFVAIAIDDLDNYVIHYTMYAGLYPTTALNATNLRVIEMTVTANSNTNTFLPAVSALVVCSHGETIDGTVDFENISTINPDGYTAKSDIATTVARNTVYTIDVYVYINGGNDVVTSANAVSLSGLSFSMKLGVTPGTD